MITHCFTMQLKPGFEKEYKQRHDDIWPELQELLSESGIEEYYIYLKEDTGTLFAFQKLKPNHTTFNLPEDPIVKKWWSYMADIMETHPDNSPVETKLKEVFCLRHSS